MAGDKVLESLTEEVINYVNRLRFPCKPLCLNIVLAAVWITVSMWVGWYATPLEHPDGFQSIGASFGDQIGQLSWPFVENFEGFEQTWGYHWFGWPMLRSWMAGLFSFSPVGDALFLHGVRALAAILVAHYIFRQYASGSAAILACATILLQKGWFCSMAFLYRPETVAALLLWLAAEPLWNQRPWPMWRRAISITALFLCPMMHPLALAAGLWIAVLGLVKGRVWAKESWQSLCLRWLLPHRYSLPAGR